MAGYTIKNLKDVDDSAASSSDVEARFARKYLDSRELGVSYFRYAPGYRSPMGHSHREQEEAYVVVAGSGLTEEQTLQSVTLVPAEILGVSQRVGEKDSPARVRRRTDLGTRRPTRASRL